MTYIKKTRAYELVKRNFGEIGEPFPFGTVHGKGKEAPDALLYIYESRNRPIAVMCLARSIDAVTYMKNTHKKKDSRNLYLQMSAAAVHDFIDHAMVYRNSEAGRIGRGGAVVMKSSVPRFYCYYAPYAGRVDFVRFTDAILKRYWECITNIELTRYETKTAETPDDNGFVPVQFSSEKIIYVPDVYPRCPEVSDGMTGEEMRTVVDCKWHNDVIAKNLWESYAEAGASKKEIERAMAETKREIAFTQGIIDDSTPEILSRVCGAVGADPGGSCEDKIRALEKIGNDDGYRYSRIIFLFADSRMRKVSRIAGRHADPDTDRIFPGGGFALDVPYKGAGTHILYTEMRTIESMLKEKGFNVTHRLTVHLNME